MAATAKVAKSSNRGSKPGERRGGRTKGTPNKATAAIRDIAGQYTEQAVNTLVSILAGGEGIPAAAQVAAAKELLDRAHDEGELPPELIELIEAYYRANGLLTQTPIDWMDE